MFEKILVPLDGSKLAENVLPRLREMIDGREVGSVILTRVARPIPRLIHDFVLDPETVSLSENAHRREAQLYLEAIERRVNWRRIAHRTEVLVGAPEIAISLFAEKERVDLILIGERPRKGLFRWAHRCLAYKLMHVSPVPVEVYDSAISKG